MSTQLNPPISGSDTSSSLLPPVVQTRSTQKKGVSAKSRHGSRARKHRRDLPPVRTSQRLHSGPWLAVSRMPRLGRRRSTQALRVVGESTSIPSTTGPITSGQASGSSFGSGFSLPHIPEGLSQEGEDSVRSLATMVVAYHQTVPQELQEEFIRQVMKFAGEKAGQLIRSSWEAR